MVAARSTVQTFRSSLALLGTRRFGTYWVATLLANTGTWAQQVAQPWLMLSLTGSAFMVGLDAFAMAAPVWVLTLVGGVLADRGDRRRIILGFQLLQMMCPLVLVVLLLAHRVERWMLIACSVVVGVTDALSMPSFKSIVPSIVEREQIGTGIALNSMQFNLSRILGPTIAGLLLAGAGAVACFALSAASYVPFILVALLLLPHGAPPRVAGARPIRSGFREIVHEPVLRGALLTVFITSAFCGPLITFCPVLVKEAFGGDAGAFSRALAAFGVGGVLGAILLLGIEGRFERRTLSTRAGAAYGLMVLLAAFTPWSWSLPALLVVAGISMSVSNTQANSILQIASAAALRGQTASLTIFSVRAGVSIGSVLTGVTSQWLGVQQALLINGVIAVSLHLWLGSRWSKAPISYVVAPA